MNKKGFIGELFLTIIIIGVLIALFFVIKADYETYQQEKKYEDFCDSRLDFCYCEGHLGFQDCEFKTSSMSSSSYSCIDGNCTDIKYSNVTLSKDTQDLCSLAKSIDDKKTMFKAGCQ